MHDDRQDESIYRGLMQRDTHALEALIERYSREMSYFIRLLLGGVGGTQDAEECTQDLFVTIWQEITTFDAARSSLRTWMTMRAKYIALDRRRQLQRRDQVVASLDSDDAQGRSGDLRRFGMPDEALSTSMEGLLEQQERREELRQALEMLPEMDRVLVYMRYFRLASTEEIANKTGLTRHAIDTRLWRARKQLRDALEEQAHGRVRVR